MVRRIGLFSLAVVFTIALFAGCSDNAVTSSPSTLETKADAAICGHVYFDGVPVGAGEATIRVTGIDVKFDETEPTDSNGWYNIIVPEDSSYQVSCRYIGSPLGHIVTPVYVDDAPVFVDFYF